MPYFKLHPWEQYHIGIATNDDDRYMLYKILAGHAIMPYLYGEIMMDLRIKTDNKLDIEPIEYEWQLVKVTDVIRGGNGIFSINKAKSYKNKKYLIGDVIKNSNTEYITIYSKEILRR